MHLNPFIKCIIDHLQVVVNRKNPRPHSSCVILTTLADEADVDDDQELDHRGNPITSINTAINGVHSNRGNYASAPVARTGSAAPCRDGSASKARRLRLNRLRLKREQRINHDQQLSHKRHAHKRDHLSLGVSNDLSDTCNNNNNHDAVDSELESDLSDCSLNDSNRGSVVFPYTCF